MSTQAYYVVSSGDYSDYSIIALLSGLPGQDMDALYEEFKETTGRPSWMGIAEWCEKLSDEWGMSEPRSAPDGRTWIVYAQEHELFIRWLTRDRSFERIEYDETNLGFW